MKLLFVVIFSLIFLVRGAAQTKISFWDNHPLRGANFMNEVPTEEWFRNAASINIEWVRLAYDKWDTEQRDFLLGDASNYRGLVKKDLKKLLEVIGWAEKYNLKVVITPLSLPGCRWSQNNGDKPDSRIWKNIAFQEKAIQFWKDLAFELKGFSCIIGYDILNEPCPELGTGIEEQTTPGDAVRYLEWYSKYKGSSHDLYLFYQNMIKAVRAVDPDTPIMVASGFYAQPSAYVGWPGKLDDLKVLYSFHMYEPYDFTSNDNFKNGGKYVYPGKIMFGSDKIWWDSTVMELYFKPFEQWLTQKSIPLNRVVAAEYGCMRRNKGVEMYLKDIVDLLENRGYHWAFYAYQEDGWDGYDYELGTLGLGWEYWKAFQRGENPKLPRKDNPLFDIIKNKINPQEMK